VGFSTEPRLLLYPPSYSTQVLPAVSAPERWNCVLPQAIQRLFLGFWIGEEEWRLSSLYHQILGSFCEICFKRARMANVSCAHADHKKTVAKTVL
jgi:hypothetical protein